MKHPSSKKILFANIQLNLFYRQDVVKLVEHLFSLPLLWDYINNSFIQRITILAKLCGFTNRISLTTAGGYCSSQQTPSVNGACHCKGRKRGVLDWIIEKSKGCAYKPTLLFFSWIESLRRWMKSGITLQVEASRKKGLDTLLERWSRFMSPFQQPFLAC